MNDLDDPIIASLSKRINEIAAMCNERIKPWVPDSAWRAQRLFLELSRPHLEYMCEYIATRPKFSFPVAWCNSVEDLVPVGDVDDYLD